MINDSAIDRDSSQKLYVQIYNILRSRIENGQWPANTYIPSEDELCRSFHVSKATVRLAITELVREGTLRRQQGKGTIVIQNVRQLGLAMKTRLTEERFGQGIDVDRNLISKGILEPPSDVRSYLNTVESVYHLECLGMAGGEPAYLEELYVPLSILPSIETEDVCHSSFYDLIQEKGIKKIFKVTQTIEVIRLTDHTAGALNVKTGAPALVVHRILFSPDSTPIAYKRFTAKVGKYKFQSELERIR